MFRRRIRCLGCRALIVIVIVYALTFPVTYFYVLNALGPSTEYYEPTIQGAELGGDGKYRAWVGDKVFVSYIIVRHKINGNCLLNVYRYGENIGGPNPGKRHLLDYVDLQFVGQNELRRPRWPLSGLVLTDDLIEPEQTEQELALYVVSRYRCNLLDYMFPRYLQGGIKLDETERTNLIVRRAP